MNTKDLIRLGVPVGEPVRLAHEFIQTFIAQGQDGAQVEDENSNSVANPPTNCACRWLVRSIAWRSRRVRNSRRCVSGAKGSKLRP